MVCQNANIFGSSGLDGTIAEYIAVPAKLLISKPAHLSFAEAAALPMALGTAWRSVMTRGKLRPGETVLIRGIGGGIKALILPLMVGEQHPCRSRYNLSGTLDAW